MYVYVYLFNLRAQYVNVYVGIYVMYVQYIVCTNVCMHVFF
jgi:hypothetical protein